MKRRVYLVLLLLPLAVEPTEAGPFSKKSPARPDPNLRVPELLFHVKMDADEKKRAAAADELRAYDPKQFPEIVPILCDVLQNDKSQGVRLEAAQSLGKIRPVSAVAGQALEQASAQDPAFRVRMQAWASLRIYQLGGYRAAQVPKETTELQIQVLNDRDGKEKSILLDSGANAPGANAPGANAPARNAAPRAPQPFRLKSSPKNTPPPGETNNVPRPLPAGPNTGPNTGPSFSTAIPNPPQRVTPPRGRINPDGPTIEPPR